MARIDKRIVKEIFGEERNNENETANAERRTDSERYRRRGCGARGILLHSLTVYFEVVPAVFLLLILLSLIFYPNPLLLSMGLLGFFC